MWFKQAQLFQLTKTMRYSPMALCEKLGELEYEECLPSMPHGAGWNLPLMKMALRLFNPSMAI